MSELQYFSPAISYMNLDVFTNICFEQYEWYPKMGYRNRCQIAGAMGAINLSIPLHKGRDQRSLVRDVKVSPLSPWQSQHWKTILSCYSRSPWFEFYRDELEDLYKTSVDFLVDWNLACFEWTLRALRLNIEISLSGEFQEHYPAGEYMDWRTGRPCAGLTPYRQVFEERIGFIPNLSILDLLFCTGKEAAKYIRS